MEIESLSELELDSISSYHICKNQIIIQTTNHQILTATCQDESHLIKRLKYLIGLYEKELTNIRELQDKNIIEILQAEDTVLQHKVESMKIIFWSSIIISLATMLGMITGSAIIGFSISLAYPYRQLKKWNQKRIPINQNVKKSKKTQQQLQQTTAFYDEKQKMLSKLLQETYTAGLLSSKKNQIDLLREEKTKLLEEAIIAQSSKTKTYTL